ncbi:MAG: isoaspartyl peptidase/L-asparaginase [Desulfurococcaceae archaeon]|uniref:Plant-type L-asparaginase n=1 Tax=Staphylothermus marinus TaxID=2280 RepID=A0A7C4D838_STAMA
MVKSIILHGGAGKWSIISSERREKALSTIEKCTKIGWSILEDENNALKSVVEAIKCMEDSGVLNAGWGSVLNLLGERSLDAGLMTSSGLIGAVANVKATRNAIELARIVAEETPHILLVGDGADELARLKKLPPLPPPALHVIENYKNFCKKLLNREPTRSYIEDLQLFLEKNRIYLELIEKTISVYDTVGACAIDDNELIVAGVSTGGLLLKIPGRVGDSAIPGAGFYATKNIACSATGIGEKIIRTMPCLRLDLEYVSTGDLELASDRVIDYVNKTVGKDSLGFIAVSRDGDITWRYNTEAILIGYVINGEVKTEIKTGGENS